VRYDGAHKYAAELVRRLGRRFELVPLCPEVAIGLGVPRPPMQLVGDPRHPRARVIEDPRRDHTARLAAYGRHVALALDDLCGYIFKSRSPSCGLARVPVFARAGAARPRGRGRGIYAAALLAGRPLLPAVEESALIDARACEVFARQVLAYHRWRRLVAEGLTPARLRRFHLRHRPFARSVRDRRALDRLVSRLEIAAGRGAPAKLAERYLALLLRALGRR
jgi:uncharacterized protein YbbK (DUF523 family)